MTRKRPRCSFVVIGMSMLAIATGLVLYSLRSGIVFFYTHRSDAQPAAEGGRSGSAGCGEGQRGQRMGRRDTRFR